jgi:predicted nucleic acid-binding protein
VSLVVVDANVAAKWFLPGNSETLTDQAFSLLDRYTKQEVRFIVPDLFWVEFANVMWKAVRLGRFSRSSGRAALAALLQYDFPTAPSLNLLESAFQIATAYERTIYDSLYVALAVHSKAQLVTADERLANSLAAHFPVKWLGAF